MLADDTLKHQGEIYAAGNSMTISINTNSADGDAAQQPQQPQQRNGHALADGHENGHAMSLESTAAPAQDLEDERAYPDMEVENAPTADPDGSSILWTMDEETVLMHSSAASLERIRERLSTLLLGVSAAIRTRAASDAAPQTGGRSKSPSSASRRGGGGGRSALDFTAQVRAADQSLRRIVGEAFSCFSEDEVAQMRQLSSLADKGATDCEELVRNAVVVLQALTHDGEAVRDVAHLRQFATTHREEITGQQWQHDFVTALRSLAVGFLRRPDAVMASYGHSVNQIVQREDLYVALLRLCGGRPIGSTPAPAGTSTAKVSAAATASHPPPATTARTLHTRTSRQPRYDSTLIHTARDGSGATQMRRISGSYLDPFMPGELPHCVMPSTPSTPLKRGGGTSQSRRASTMTRSRPSLSVVQEKHEIESSAAASTKRPSNTRAEPMPEVPRRVSVHRAASPSMAHY
ncbi:hypothetical protein NESM_000026800 [Novymonas esmeraldas]|uniref:Uncharacterized protein n=1 Tax=Novymonas esmeraldas TaxID=1808958 RepID=A0AAW0F0S3_9TRYP